MDTRLVRELRILLPSANDDDDLTEAATTDPSELRYREVGALNWSRLRLMDIAVTGCQFSGTTLRDSGWEKSTISGVIFEQVDLSSSRLQETKVDRTRFTGCQLSGVVLTEANLSNVIFENCRLDYATFRSVRTTGPVAFVNCTFTEASLTACRWNEVVFDSCRLTSLELDGCDLHGADFRGNSLDSIRGLTSLQGTTITADQLSDLSQALIADLDLQISDPPSNH